MVEWIFIATAIVSLVVSVSGAIAVKQIYSFKNEMASAYAEAKKFAEIITTQYTWITGVCKQCNRQVSRLINGVCPTCLSKPR
jgi:hypothetical protein